LHGAARFLGQRQQALGIAQQDLTGGCEVQSLALADEQRDAQIVLKLADAGGHVGLDTAQPLGGARDAAFVNHRAEDQEIGQVHSSLQLFIS